MKIICLLMLFCCHSYAQKLPLDNPYFCAYSIENYCSGVFFGLQNSTIVPEEVKAGDILVVRTEVIGEFFQHIHPKIANPYVLVTHHSDSPAPGNFAHMLNDPKILAWFGINVEGATHPKLHPIPIGVHSDISFPNSSTALLEEVQQYSKSCQKNTLLYMNFNVRTFSKERKWVFKHFKRRPFCSRGVPKAHRDYLLDLAGSKFVLSPRGNGIDCYRTWEALIMGAIPIVRSSPLDPLYEGLPVLIVHDWRTITEGFLNAKWAEMQAKEYQMERLYAPYWLAQIFSCAGNKQ